MKFLGQVARRSPAVSLAICLLAAESYSAPAKVIIDTDPGIDDAFAVIFAFHSPDLEIASSITGR